MATTAPKLPEVEEQNPVDTMLDEVVRRFTDNGGEITVRNEAVRIVAWLERREPELLTEWFREHMISILGQHLQIRLAQARRSSRARSVFADASTEAVTEQPTSPFSRGYACPGNRWVPLGDMRRPDWDYIIDDRAPRAIASLFEIELAKKMRALLPDDKTLTREVVSESDLERIEDQARAKATKTVQRIERA